VGIRNRRGEVSASPLVVGSTVLVGSEGHVLYAVAAGVASNQNSSETDIFPDHLATGKIVDQQQGLESGARKGLRFVASVVIEAVLYAFSISRRDNTRTMRGLMPSSVDLDSDSYSRDTAFL